MQKPMIWLGALVLAVTVQAQDFTRTMTAEEQAAAGLEKLSPAELAKLKAAVERYKAGAVAVVQEQAEQKVAATQAQVQEASRQAAMAEAKAKEAEGKAAMAEAKAKAAQNKPTVEEKKGPSWLGALITLRRAESKPDAEEAIETRLAGSVSTFEGRRSFTLENGQVWQMTEADAYAGPTYDRPVVRIRPGAFGNFWLQIPEAAIRVKVKPVRLE
jgi:hypothetical protein